MSWSFAGLFDTDICKNLFCFFHCFSLAYSCFFQTFYDNLTGKLICFHN